ncbi:MAG: sugar phosphate isomerase/epimerase [Anaerolineae bacterium]|nr:sugar phosphate isomerase/epimerase [Anaerolineae bacterium]
MMIKLGTTTLALNGWLADPGRPRESQQQRLAAIRQIVQGYGLAAVELALDLPMIYPSIFDASFYDTVAELQEELGFTCTAHLPFLWIEPASLNVAIRRASVDSLQRGIQLTRRVKVDTYVLHLWGLATTLITAQLEAPAARQAIMQVLAVQAGRCLAELCETVEPRDICIENLEDSHLDLTLALADQHNTSLCFDVGHLVWQGGDALDFLSRHGDQIREVHLHDATRQSTGGATTVRDHLALGQGQVDYQRILEKLGEMRYDGPVILEVNSEADLEESLRALGKEG